MIDFHSHILPGIDDGSPDIETSLLLLEEEKKQGVDTIVFTPHFYPDRNTIDDFLRKRDEAFIKLQSAEGNENFPKFIPGAEVALTYEVPKLPDLEKLCICGTNLILIELPYHTYNEWVLNALFEISARGLHPVIAHFERFVTFEFFKALYEKILAMNFDIQINASFIFSRKEMKFLKTLIKQGYIPVLGSDVHNTTSRFIHLEEARKVVKKKFKDEILQKINNKPYELLEKHRN